MDTGPTLQALNVAADRHPVSITDRLAVRRVGATQAAVIVRAAADLGAWRAYLAGAGFEVVDILRRPLRPRLIVRIAPVQRHTYRGTRKVTP